ncbi:hypothetical protein Agub_g14552 [Astrephomene gubernaculifera]|uniref:Uncharacterized protein n=1 Tax=Astrephomene gubernaculifera TaxID=47775 RepID=A0AAD3E1R1_9CHLO|nr:hypothetical protein Agub_g14552 [Astrephomene gubernaculifera]
MTMGLEHMTFLQGLSELERSALLADAHPGGDCFPFDVVGEAKISRGHGSDKSDRAECEQLKLQLKGERERRQQLEAQVSSLQAALTDQSVELDELRSNRNLLRQRALRNDEQGSRLAASVTSLEQENASLTAKLLAASNERAQLVSKLETLQVRVSELQQNCVSMASCCEDGVERRDILRRSRLGGLMRDAAAAGALDADLQQSLSASVSLDRPASNKAVGNTIASLTRERDVLQQRVNELSTRLADAVGREGAARGAQALRSACWKRSAVQAEAKLAAALKRVKDLSEELRKRDLEARQRDKYTSQLERTIIAQHKTLQQQRRLLEAGETASASATGGTGATAARVGGPHQDDDDAMHSAGLANKGAACDKLGAAAMHAAQPRDGGKGPSSSFAAPPSSAVAGDGSSSAASGGGAAAGSGVGGGGGLRLAWPGPGLQGSEAPRSRSRYSPTSSPQRQPYSQHPMQQQPPQQQGFRELQQSQQLQQDYLQGPFLVDSSCWSSPESPSDASRGRAPPFRASADGSDPWVLPPLPSGLSGRLDLSVMPLVLQQRGQPAGLRAGCGQEQLLAGEQAASPVDLVNGCMRGTANTTGTRSNGLPASSGPRAAPLQQQLSHVEASLAQLYRELEEFKDYSMQRNRYEEDRGRGGGGGHGGGGNAVLDAGDVGGAGLGKGAADGCGDSELGSPPPVLQRCATPPRRSRSEGLGAAAGRADEGGWQCGEEEDGECSHAPTFAMPSSPTFHSPGSSRLQQHRPGEGSTARAAPRCDPWDGGGQSPSRGGPPVAAASASTRTVSEGGVRRSAGMLYDEDDVSFRNDGVIPETFFHAGSSLPGAPAGPMGRPPYETQRALGGLRTSDDGSVQSMPHRPAGSAALPVRTSKAHQAPQSASWASAPVGGKGRPGTAAAVQDPFLDEVESSVAASCGSSVRQPEREYGGESLAPPCVRPAGGGNGGCGGGGGFDEAGCSGCKGSAACQPYGGAQVANAEGCGYQPHQNPEEGGEAGAQGATAPCQQAEDEQPRQPLPNHVLGHLMRCTHHAGPNQAHGSSGRGGSANRAFRHQGSTARAANSPSGSAFPPAARAAVPGTSSKRPMSPPGGLHGSPKTRPDPRVSGVEELTRILRATPAGSAATSRHEDSAQQHRRGQAASHRGQGAWGRASGGSRSPTSTAAPAASAAASDRNAAAAAESSGALTCRTGAAYGASKEQRPGPRSAHVHGTWGSSGPSKRTSSMRNSVNVPSQLSSPRTPSRGSVQQHHQTAAAGGTAAAAGGSTLPQQLASPLEMSPISTLLANISSSPTGPRASMSSHSTSQAQACSSRQYDDVSSAPSQPFITATTTSSTSHANHQASAAELHRNNVTSSSCMQGGSQAGSWPGERMLNGASGDSTRAGVRSGGGGASSSGSAGVAHDLHGNYAPSGPMPPRNSSGGATLHAGPGPGPVEVLPTASERACDSKGSTASQRPTLGGWLLAEATSRVDALALLDTGNTGPRNQHHQPVQQHQQQQNLLQQSNQQNHTAFWGPEDGGCAPQASAAGTSVTALQRLRDKRLQRISQQQPQPQQQYGSQLQRQQQPPPPQQQQGCRTEVGEGDDWDGGSGGGGLQALDAHSRQPLLTSHQLPTAQLMPPALAEEGSLRALRDAMRASSVGSAGPSSSRDSAGGAAATATSREASSAGGGSRAAVPIPADSLHAAEDGVVGQVPVAQGRESSGGQRGLVAALAGSDRSNTREYSSGGAWAGAPQAGLLDSDPSSSSASAVPPAGGHPLMQLLGQASADLQLLSSRLKPLVGGNGSS